MCVAGEARPDDPALVDRLVSVTPDRNRLSEHPEHVEAYRRTQAADLARLAAPYIQWTLSRDTEADLKAASQVTDRVLGVTPGGTSVSLRCRDNLCVVVFGLAMFEAFAKHLGVTGLPAPDLKAVLSASVADLMDGERGAKDPLDLFIETCSVLAYAGTLIADKHYTVVDGLTCLHLRSCWEVYLEHQHRIGQVEAAADIRVIRRLLHENHQRGGYVKDLSKTVSMGNRRPRTIAVDLTQATEFLDVDAFLTGPSHTWGVPGT